jgi:hypothetical protein
VNDLLKVTDKSYTKALQIKGLSVLIANQINSHFGDVSDAMTHEKACSVMDCLGLITDLADQLSNQIEDIETPLMQQTN